MGTSGIPLGDFILEGEMRILTIAEFLSQRYRVIQSIKYHHAFVCQIILDSLA